MFIVLDNAESILDPQGRMLRIYTARWRSCVNWTRYVSASHPEYPPSLPTARRSTIPTLSMEAARDVFYRIYEKHGRSDLVDDILKQLEFHRTVSHLTRHGRATKQWDYRTADEGVGGTANGHAGRTIGQAWLPRSNFRSPLRCSTNLGPTPGASWESSPSYPQGINENNARLVVPTISSGTRIFDKFCIFP
jgi:hypothetical protein